MPFGQWPAEARLLLGMVALWCLLGLVVLGSASWWVAAREMGDASYYLKRQALWLIASWGLLYLGLRVNLRRWLRLAGPALLVGMVLVALTLVIGSTVNGASRWLVIGPIQIQPTELIKPFLVLQGAALFSHWSRIANDQKLIWLGVFALTLGLILKQPNLSTASLCGILLWLMALGSGLPLWAMLGTAGAGLAVAVGSISINDYQRARVTSFLDPWKDAQGDGYQLVQSLLAIGCTTLLVGQSILNIAVASGAMPTTGLPLPMISYGGNSLLSSLLTAGLLLRCSLEGAGLEPGRPRRREERLRSARESLSIG